MHFLAYFSLFWKENVECNVDSFVGFLSVRPAVLETSKMLEFYWVLQYFLALRCLRAARVGQDFWNKSVANIGLKT